MAKGVRIDIEKLRGALYGKTKDTATKIGINPVSLTRRLMRPMSLEELNEICHSLNRSVYEFLEDYETTDEEMVERRKKRDELKRKRKLVGSLMPAF